MKFMTEYRQRPAIEHYLEQLHRVTTKQWTIMEVCGGQTHAIVKYRLQELIPDKLRLVHGPGCPVCVSSLEVIDKAIAIAKLPNVTLCSFGDMLRVPGSQTSLLEARASGADIRILYSPLDMLDLAKQDPDVEHVFFAVGFETTAPAIAMLVHQAKLQGLGNVSILSSHFRVPPAMEAVLSSPQNVVQGFLAAGHVCTVMGCTEYDPIAARYSVPIVVTGFEPLDLVEGLYRCVKQLEEGQAKVENQYVRSVSQVGNAAAQDLLKQVFAIQPQKWRGIGSIDHSGLGLAPAYHAFDAEQRFAVSGVSASENPLCISAEIMQGFKKPAQCPAFGTQCTPQHPLGAPMVSSEGACAAYYRYQGVSA